MEKQKSLHAYIKDELLNRIKSHTYKVGEQIPTENELCKTFDVSRTTVRTALNQLTMEGYLIRQQGKGTYVADQKVSTTLSHTIKRYSDQMAVQGKKADISLISLDVIPATELHQRVLEVNLNDPIQQIERVRKVDGEPTQYDLAYIPWNVAPGITKEHAESSLYAALKDDFKVHIALTREFMEITLTDERIHEHLNYELGLPCFYIETVAEDEHGKKVEYGRSYFRGDKTSFMIERNYPQDEQ